MYHAGVPFSARWRHPLCTDFSWREQRANHRAVPATSRHQHSRFRPMKRKCRAPSPTSPRSRRSRSSSPVDDASSPAAVRDVTTGRSTVGVSRERALYFATGERPSSVAQPPSADKEAWPGYFATAQQLHDNRQAAQAARKQRQDVEQLQQSQTSPSSKVVEWHPKRVPRASVLTANDVVQKLKDTALEVSGDARRTAADARVH
uniref:Uncharacterized protein n=1 Tax=Peronospora matthiolae TaxID=2874970 RepID=A0AAV1V7B6_9STRA